MNREPPRTMRVLTAARAPSGAIAGVLALTPRAAAPYLPPAHPAGPHVMYKAVTRGIRVTVEPRFVEEESQPEKGRFFFAYTIEITNLSTDRVQLESRHWTIIDGLGRFQKVNGAGVVGKQPVLGPGESFTYTSGCPLDTPDGTMEGSYLMLLDTGEAFKAEIPAFALDSPFAKRILH